VPWVTREELKRLARAVGVSFEDLKRGKAAKE
jgi:hypothetical protein